MPLTYGIDTALWVRLPPDDQAAVKAEFFGQPPPPIGGYAPSVPGPTATPVPATPAPPPTLSSSGAQAYALLNPPQGAKPVVGVVKPPQKATTRPTGEATASTLAAREATLGSVQAVLGKTGSVAPAGGYYTYKDDVPLKLGQTLGFTKGKGYHAAGTPTPMKAATNPASPAGLNITSTSGTTHYTYKEEVHLKPGQTVGFSPGKGYYGVDAPIQRKLAASSVLATNRRVEPMPAAAVRKNPSTGDARLEAGSTLPADRFHHRDSPEVTSARVVVTPSARAMEQQFRRTDPADPFQRAHYEPSIVQRALTETMAVLQKDVQSGKMSLSVANDRLTVVARALSTYGTQYVFGGGHGVNAEPSHGFGNDLPAETPAFQASHTGLDCSGLVRYAFHGVDPALGDKPGSTYSQYADVAEHPQAASQLKPGDLIFYNSLGGSVNDHVAIYIGNGKIVDAPQTRVSGGTTGPYDFVRIENMYKPGGFELPILGFGRAGRF